jgi:hypothetical protein
MVSPTENLTMRLILSFNVSDDCTFSYTETVPIEAESPEAAIVEFEEQCTAAKARCEKSWFDGEFTAFGRTFDTTNFYSGGLIQLPSIQTFDEWFEANKE